MTRLRQWLSLLVLLALLILPGSVMAAGDPEADDLPRLFERALSLSRQGDPNGACPPDQCWSWRIAMPPPGVTAATSA